MSLYVSFVLQERHQDLYNTAHLVESKIPISFIISQGRESN